MTKKKKIFLASAAALCLALIIISPYFYYDSKTSLEISKETQTGTSTTENPKIEYKTLELNEQNKKN